MKGNIITGPTREELSRTMFFHGERVKFTLLIGNIQFVVMAVVTDVHFDGSYKDGLRSGMFIVGNCRIKGEIHFVDYEAFYDLAAVASAEDPFLGQFETK